MRPVAKRLMFLGTGSDVGKSVLAAAFCRILRQDGYRVAPFKAQNMALNSFITPDGDEMGRAQVVQAEAAGIAPHVDMNPILLKPTSHVGSQVIVEGKPVGNFSALEYYEYKKSLVPLVRRCFDRLAGQYDVIVLEGAGSAVELNLKDHDLVNMAMADMADAPCVLVGDIDRGGIFAALLGSFMLMTPPEQNRLAGFMVNKLRGDPRLFESGVSILEERSGRPVLGVIPYFDHFALQEEDSLALGRRMTRLVETSPDEHLLVGVVRFPFVSNYTDFDCFEHEPGVELVYFDRPADIFRLDCVILPGSKNTLEDLEFLRRTGLAEAIVAFSKAGGTVVGLCGGYQMLGCSVRDPHGVESALREVAGLGLLQMDTEMYLDKITTQVEAVAAEGLPGNGAGNGGEAWDEVLRGYEIHMGRSAPMGSEARALFRIVRRNGLAVESEEEGQNNGRRAVSGISDGLVTPDGRVWGTYIHGVFDNDGFRRHFLETLKQRSAKSCVALSSTFSYHQWKEKQYDLLADHVRQHSDVRRIYRAMGLL